MVLSKKIYALLSENQALVSGLIPLNTCTHFQQCIRTGTEYKVLVCSFPSKMATKGVWGVKK